MVKPTTKKQPRRQLKPVIGIVGGIGAGKSTAAGEFARLGCAVIDADAIGHELLAEPAVRRRIVRRWGPDVLGASGEVDRKALAAVVFQDAGELEALNRIMHPLIARRVKHRMSAARKDAAVPTVVIDAAVLLEGGWDALCTHLIFVSAASATRADRAARRAGWARTAWRQREKSQIPLDKKRRRCDYILDNSSSVSHLCKQVRRVFRQIVPNAG
jgi:dephospho-CoA kinase